jgi:hypothetical protein
MNNQYLTVKAMLIEIARQEKKDNPNDKPRVRQVLNDSLDSFIRDLDRAVLREQVTEKRFKLWCKWLESLVCRLQP